MMIISWIFRCIASSGNAAAIGDACRSKRPQADPLRPGTSGESVAGPFQGGFDVIHAHHIEGLLVSLPSRLLHNVPVVYDAHTMLESELPSYGPRLSHWLVGAAGGWVDGWLPRTADHVASVTPDIRDSMLGQSHMSPDRVSVVMNGVEAGTFRVEVPPPADGYVRLIYSGTLAPYQDIDLLLVAFARARRSRKDLKLVFSVSSPFEPYEEHAKRLGIRDAIEVISEGFDELPARLAASSIAVLPRTQCAGIPQKLLNYMAAGKAIVSSAGSAKVIEHERTGSSSRTAMPRRSPRLCCGWRTIPLAREFGDQGARPTSSAATAGSRQRRRCRESTSRSRCGTGASPGAPLRGNGSGPRASGRYFPAPPLGAVNEDRWRHRLMAARLPSSSNRHFELHGSGARSPVRHRWCRVVVPGQAQPSPALRTGRAACGDRGARSVC